MLGSVQLETNMNRKQRRTLNKMMGKETASMLQLMLNIPDKCMSCEKPFDRKDKEMVTTWQVAVFNEQRRVELRCPECATVQGQ
jgi:hypothetical protein